MSTVNDLEKAAEPSCPAPPEVELVTCKWAGCSAELDDTQLLEHLNVSKFYADPDPWIQKSDSDSCGKIRIRIRIQNIYGKCAETCHGKQLKY